MRASSTQNLLNYALDYAAHSWPVFPLSGKVPFRGSHGHLDATTDPETIRAMWAAHSHSNIGLACGEVVVADCDGPGGLDQLKALAEPYGGIPRTLVARTKRGWHLFFRAPAGIELRTYNSPRVAKGDDGLDIKAHGGYVVLPPADGRAWANNEPIAELPGWLIAWVNERRTPHAAKPAQVDTAPLLPGVQRPTWLRPATRRISEGAAASDETDFRAALFSLPAACGYDDWFEIGAAIHDYDPSANGLKLFREWSWGSENHRERIENGTCETKWAEYDKNAGKEGLIKAASIFYRAQQLESEKAAKELLLKPSNETVIADHESVNDAHETVNGASYALPPELLKPAAIHWVDTKKGGAPISTCANTCVALRRLGVECQHDTFHNKLLVGGHTIDEWAGELSDNAIQMIRVLVRSQYGFDPGLQHAHDAAVQECLQRSFDPVADYLDGLVWDRVPRVAGWLTTYLGAEDTRLNRAIGTLTLMAAVRRVRQPGCKFDQIIVLESPEGRGKSSAIEILAGAENFSDQTILTLDDKGQQEAVQGIWLYEIADFSGLPKSDDERVKAFASRRFDRARPAYGRARVDRPRRCIFFATTNGERYLKSQTGNRRFWPVRIGRIDLEALTRDRDQLWAEACCMEATGHSLALPESFWGAARDTQDSRQEEDPWEVTLETVKPRHKHPTIDGQSEEWRLATKVILDQHLQVGPEKQNMGTLKRIAFIMRKLGWHGPDVMKIGDEIMRGYRKPA